MTDASAKPIRYLALSEDDDADDDSGQQGSSGGGGGLHYVEIGCLESRAGGHTQWVLERTVVTVPRTSDAGHALGDAVDNYVAAKISDRAFAFSDTWWIVSDPGRLGVDDEVVQRTQEGLHKLLLGDPAKAVCQALRVPAPGTVAGIAGQLALPIDRPLGLIEQLLQVAGMAVGVCAGMPVLTTACCKAFLHDQFTRGVARGTRAVIENALAPAPAPKPPDVGTRPPGDGPTERHPAPARTVTSPNVYRPTPTRGTIGRNPTAQGPGTRPGRGGGFTTSR
jgi:hypothetical protein